MTQYLILAGFLPWILLALFIWSRVRRNRRERAIERGCVQCGTVFSGAKRQMAGLGTEFALLLLCILPGLIYGVWRQTTKAFACPGCGSRQLVPTSTPEGQRILARAEAVR